MNVDSAPIVVVHAGDPAGAVAATERGTGRPPWEIRPRPLVAEGQAPGVTPYGGGAPLTCAAKTTASGVRKHLSDAETALAGASWTEVRTAAAAALTDAECLSESAEPSVLARAALVLGVAQSELGEAPDKAFDRALLFQPALAWDPALPGKAQAAFETARTAATGAPQGAVVLGPGAEATTLWLDGKPTPVAANTVSLRAGRHLVQYVAAEVRTFAVDVPANGTVALLDPTRLAPDVVAHADDPATVAYLEPFVATTDASYLWTGTHLLDAKAGLADVPLRARADTAPAAAKSRPLPGALLVAGIGLLGVGGVSTGIGAATYVKNADGLPGEDDEAYARRIIAAGAGSGMTLMGLTACGVGATSLIVAIPLELRRRK